MVKRSQRLVALFAAVIILFEVAAVPQKAKAVALTASVVASVAAILTACGVSYWATSQTEVVDYLGGKIDEYMDTLSTSPASYEEWLGINAASQLFEVTASGAMQFGSRVAGRIVDFCQWFKKEYLDKIDGSILRAGGSPCHVWFRVDDANDIDQPRAIVMNDGRVLLSALQLSDLSVSYSRYIAFTADVGTDIQCVVTCDDVNHSGLQFYVTTRPAGEDSNNIMGGYGYTSLTSGAHQSVYVGAGQEIFVQVSSRNESASFPNLQAIFSFTNYSVPVALTPATNEITKQDVFIPSVDPLEDFYVSPSVSLNPAMSVESAAEKLYEGVTSEDGLTSEVGSAEAEGGALEGWGWLSDTLSAIHDFIADIAQTVLGIPQAIGQAAQDIISGIQALPGMISDTLTDLFVPDEAFVETYVDSLVGLFESRVGILTYPLSLFVQFLHRFTQISDGDHIFRWGAIREPFSGRQVIAAGSYDLDDAVASGPMSGVYSTYLLVVKAIVSFWFLHLCQKKYDQIINRH